VEFKPCGDGEATLAVRGAWRSTAPRIDVRVPGFSINAVSEQSFRLVRSIVT
jgi:hypothetical protein